MHHPTDRIAHTTAFVTPVVEHWLERDIQGQSAHLVCSGQNPADGPIELFSVNVSSYNKAVDKIEKKNAM